MPENLTLDEIRELSANTAERRELLRRARCFEPLVDALEKIAAEISEPVGFIDALSASIIRDAVRAAIALAQNSEAPKQ